jgi:hypothetical protein
MAALLAGGGPAALDPAAVSAGGPGPAFALCRAELISGRGLADAAAPDRADGQRVSDGRGGVAVDQQQVGAPA